jgi:predicted ATPase/DNA-binding XRE family transcriptional regulator
VDHSFGNWVKRRRKAVDLTQQQLAQKVGCSLTMIVKIEADERRPSRQVAELLAQVLEIPPEQHELFLKVARQQKGAHQLDEIAPLSPPPLDPVTPSSQTDLPVPITSLIGREHELQMIVRQLQDSDCRLLTLLGPGGVGKTRLALEVAQRLREEFHQAISFVSFAGTSAPEFMVPAIADSLGFSFLGSTEPKSQLLNFLREKHVLLVLDNLEHLLEGVELLDDLLTHAPSIKILATSREQLNVRAEWTFEVQGLPVPQSLEWNVPASNSAVSLFIERARHVRASFTPTDEDLRAIARICQLVDGLPLGLELAATWVRALSCPEIETEIRRSLDFLAASQRDMPERHRSLRAVFDYSWNLLTSEEKNVLEKLSVFKGGFQRDAAAQVAAANLPMLSVLIGKSLIRRNESGRYEQHELVRQYAMGRLQQDAREESATRDRHAAYYLGLWSARENDMKSPRQWETTRELGADIDNFRAAWDWAVWQKQPSALFQCLRTFLSIYDLRGWYVEGLERLDAFTRVAAQHPNRQYNNAQGLAVSFQGWLQFRRGQLPKAREWFEQGITILRASQDQIALAEALTMYGPVLTSLGEGDPAIEIANESLAMARVTDDMWHIAYALMMRGGILAGRGIFEEAYANSREALAYFRQLGDTRLTVVTLNTLGFSALQLSRFEEARKFLQESLSLASTADDPWSVGTAYGNLGLVDLAQGHGVEAQKDLQISITHFTDLGMLGDVAFYLTYLGETYAMQGDLVNAQRHWWDAVRRAREIESLPNLLANLIRLAQVERRNLRTAYETAIFVLDHPASWQESKNRAAALTRELEAQIPSNQQKAARSHAQRMSVDAFIEALMNPQGSLR